MTTKILYRYKKDNYTIDSPNKPEGEYIERYRLVADENKMLTKNGTDLYTVIDINKEDQFYWYEVDKPQELIDAEAEREAKRQAKLARLAQIQST